MLNHVIEEIKKSELTGRGGAGFPTGLKWELVKKEKADKKYIICNGSEGERGVFKDEYILKNYLDDVLDGIRIALETFKNSQAYIYLNKKYYKDLKPEINKKASYIKVFKKPEGYIAGEETTILNVIEKGEKEPRKKPPYPTQKGLFRKPTLVNNVETFYYISKIVKGKYKKTRFYCISGEVENKGVFELSINKRIETILKETKNYPKFDFFVQSGGGVCGEILLKNELRKKVSGIGSIIVYKKDIDPFDLMEEWAKFFVEGNCDKCVPCREGIYRLYEMIKQREINVPAFNDILNVMEKSSFCPLGSVAVVPFRGLYEKILK